MKSNRKTETICHSRLIKERGWSNRLITLFLPQPTSATNPWYKCAAPMKLYRMSDVLAAEASSEFQIEHAKMMNRRSAAQKVAEDKTNELQEHMLALAASIVIEVIDDDELIDRTLTAKEAYFSLRGDYPLLCETLVESATLHRWVVNYIRHNLTPYDGGLKDLPGRIGRYKVYPLYKVAILQKIAEAYPKYAEECARQSNKYRV